MVQSLTNRWILTLGLATLCFGISLFVLRIPIRTIGIFFALGIPLILLWLYTSDRSKQQLQQQLRQSCICPVCKHEQAGVCLNQKCACCIIMKGNKVVGHSINPLQ
jgi:Flp pilus assembly protein TadB